MRPESFAKNMFYKTIVSRKTLFEKEVNRYIVRMRDAYRFSSMANTFSRNAYKLRSPEEYQAISAPFFVVGSPRSGTTLLRELINKHPNLIVPPENGVILQLFQSYWKHRHMDWNTIVDLFIEEFSDGYEASYWQLDLVDMKKSAVSLPHAERTLSNLFYLPYQQYALAKDINAARWGDKSTPGGFSYLYKMPYVYPDAQYIVIVRDGRDVAASCVNAGFYDNSYTKSIEAWVNNNRTIRHFQKSISLENLLRIRYEDLVAKPDAVVANIYKFLSVSEISINTQMNKVDEPSKDILEISHHKNVTKPVTNAYVGNWREKIPFQYQEIVNRIAKNELQYCGYEK